MAGCGSGMNPTSSRANGPKGRAGHPVTHSTTTTPGPGAPDIRSLLRGFSIELSSDETAIDAAAAHLEPATDVYVNWLPENHHHRSVAAAVKLRGAGFNPVPHVAARYLTGRTQLADFLARLPRDASVRHALTVGRGGERRAGGGRRWPRPARTGRRAEGAPARARGELPRRGAAAAGPAIAGLHFFPFGGFLRTAAWAREPSSP